MALLNITSKQEFKDKVLDSEKVVLVDFWATWCPPCRMMTPILEDISKHMADDVDIAKVNVEESADNGALAQEYGVQGIPNMQVFKGGKVVDTFVGMRPANILEEDLKKHL